MVDEEPTSKANDVLWTVVLVVVWMAAIVMAIWVLKVTFVD